MKAILVIDYASEEDIGKKASIRLTNGENKYKWIEYVTIKPMPMKRETQVHWKSIGGGDIPTHEISDYDKGWNDCVEFLEGEENE